MSAALADGVYICHEQTLKSAGWTAGHIDKFKDANTDNVEVLNLQENDTVGAYEEALAKGDKMMAWEWRDSLGNSKWVGQPLTPSVRRVRTTAGAGADNNIVCNLIANDGESEILAVLGAGVTVYFSATEGMDVDSAIPLLADDDYLFAQNISGKWHCVTVLQAKKNCVCTEP